MSSSLHPTPLLAALAATALLIFPLSGPVAGAKVTGDPETAQAAAPAPTPQEANTAAAPATPASTPSLPLPGHSTTDPYEARIARLEQELNQQKEKVKQAQAAADAAKALGQPPKKNAPTTDQATTATGLETEVLPPVELITPRKASLDGKQKKAVRLAREWATRQDSPARGENGVVKYTFGATLPTLVCAPLQICMIQFQPGETIKTVVGSDKARWLCTLHTTGSGATLAPAIGCKPTDAGLKANLVVMTDKRTYSIELLSDPTDWMPLVSFDYPDDAMDLSLASYQKEVARNREAQPPQGPINAQANPSALDFNFTVEGDSPDWKPVRVYSDGKKTYIQFPEAFGGEVPALVALDGSDGIFSKAPEKLVNYRVIGDRFVVDRVIDQAALIMGVGSDQVRVRISHEKKGA